MLSESCIKIEEPNLEVKIANLNIFLVEKRTLLNRVKWKLFSKLFPIKYRWIKKEKKHGEL